MAIELVKLEFTPLESIDVAQLAQCLKLCIRIARNELLDKTEFNALPEEIKNQFTVTDIPYPNSQTTESEPLP
jgi:hypothetical protein